MTAPCASTHVTHVLSLAAKAARQLMVGLLDTLDEMALDDDAEPAGGVRMERVDSTSPA